MSSQSTHEMRKLAIDNLSNDEERQMLIVHLKRVMRLEDVCQWISLLNLPFIVAGVLIGIYQCTTHPSSSIPVLTLMVSFVAFRFIVWILDLRRNKAINDYDEACRQILIRVLGGTIQ